MEKEVPEEIKINQPEDFDNTIANKEAEEKIFSLLEDSSEVAFEPVALDTDETKDKDKQDQLAIDNELQRKIRENETVYKSELSKLHNYGLKFTLKGQDPVGINGCVFAPYVTYTIGNRIVSPDGVFLITNDIMQCALTIDSNAMLNEKKISQAGGGSVEITEHGGVKIQTTRT